MSQYLPGLCFMFGLMKYKGLDNEAESVNEAKFDKLKLIIGGSSYGLTGLFYYLAVITIPVSVSVILLMQAIWMGVALEAVLTRRWPSLLKIIAMGTTLIGTVLSVYNWSEDFNLDKWGMFWGVASAISYTAALTVSNSTKRAITF